MVDSANQLRQEYENGISPIEGSGWVAAKRGQVYPRLDRDIETDIVVVGGGLAGAAVALHLAEKNQRVVLLEAKQPAFAASGRNAGHICPYLRDIKALQKSEVGGRLIEYFVENKNLVFELCERHKIKCDTEKTGYLDVSRRRWFKERFKSEAAVWGKLNYEVDYVESARLKVLTGTDEYGCGIYWRDGGRVNPFLFTHGMVEAATRFGAQVFGDSRADACERRGDRWLVKAANGSILAQKILLCTNGHHGNAIFPELSRTNYPLLACGLSTKPLSKNLLDIILPSKAVMIQYPAGLNPIVIDGMGRIVTGQIPFGKKAHDAELHFYQLIKFLHRAYPATQSEDILLDSYWTGKTANTPSDYPVIYDVADGIIALMNLCSWGNLMGPLLGKNLADAIIHERMNDLVLPVEKPRALRWPSSMELRIRHFLIPAARLADKVALL